MPCVEAFHDERTDSLSYVVACSRTRRAAVVDPVMDYDAAGGRTGFAAAERLVRFLQDNDLSVEWILETHVHADHLSAAQYFRERFGAPVAIGERVREVQRTWRDIYSLGEDFPADGSQFDRLFADAEEFAIGGLRAKVMHTPGHTPACVTYLVQDCAFVGDTLFMPDFGTARCDFPGGDAATLFRSVRRLLSLPDDTRIFVGHDYRPGGRPLAYQSTVALQRQGNWHVKDGVDEAGFVAMRRARDRELSPPGLLLPAIQVNIRAGRLPEAEPNGTAYLRIPLNRL